MKTIPLTQGYHAFVDDEDYVWLSCSLWYAHVKRSRKNPVAYAVRKEKGRTLSMAVEIAKHAGIWVHGLEIDHADGNRLNNQRCNLRAVTGSQNQANQLPRAGTSRYKGVSWDRTRGLWNAHIGYQKQKLHIGAFEFEEGAAMAYDAKALQLFGQYARLNFDPRNKP
jgi:hypothetical protein